MTDYARDPNNLPLPVNDWQMTDLREIQERINADLCRMVAAERGWEEAGWIDGDKFPHEFERREAPLHNVNDDGTVTFPLAHGGVPPRVYDFRESSPVDPPVGSLMTRQAWASALESYSIPRIVTCGIDPASPEAYSWGDLSSGLMWVVPEEPKFEAFPTYINETVTAYLEIQEANLELLALMFGLPVSYFQVPLCDQEIPAKGTE